MKQIFDVKIKLIRWHSYPAVANMRVDIAGASKQKLDNAEFYRRLSND